MQIVKQSDEEKLKMYLKCNKVELVKMLIEANKHLENRTTIILSTPKIAWRKVLSMDRLPDDKLDLSKEEYLQIYIESVKDGVGFGPGSDEKGFYPVSTIGYYRTTKEGKKQYFTDADSGEQAGLATNIPEEIKKILLSFGFEERRDE